MASNAQNLSFIEVDGKSKLNVLSIDFYSSKAVNGLNQVASYATGATYEITVEYTDGAKVFFEKYANTRDPFKDVKITINHPHKEGVLTEIYLKEAAVSSISKHIDTTKKEDPYTIKFALAPKHVKEGNAELTFAQGDMA